MIFEIPPMLIPVLCFGAAIGLVILTEWLADRFENRIPEEEEES